MKNIAIIYHNADMDGRLSNGVCRFYLEHNYPEAAIHSYGWDYGRPLPVLIPLCYVLDERPSKVYWSDYDAIYIVDLSVDELMARPELRSKVVWIDHHKSAIEKWDGIYDDHGIPNVSKFNGFRIDGVAACRLCLQWFTVIHLNNTEGGDVKFTLPNKQDFIDRKVFEPELIRLAGEYDCWDHRDPDAKALQFGLRALGDREISKLVRSQFNGGCGGEILLEQAIQTGRSIKSYCDKQNAEYAAAHCHTIKFHGLTMCALNIGQRGSSDLFNGGIKPEHQALFAWRHTGDGETPIYVSLYHAPDHEGIDLSKIASRWGGGGHKGACGFRIRLPALDGILGGFYNSEVDGVLPVQGGVQ